jgi:hypothetical protein
MFWRRDEVDAESFQIVIRVCKSGDFRLASIAGAGVQLADVQGPLQQRMNPSARLFRTDSERRHLRAAVDVIEANRLLFRYAAAGEMLRNDYCPQACFRALAAANALTVRQP